MKPINFPEQNMVFTKPENMTDEECSSLPTFTNNEQIVSCWELTDEEIRQIQITRQVWVILWSKFQPPLSLVTENPFIQLDTTLESSIIGEN